MAAAAGLMARARPQRAFEFASTAMNVESPHSELRRELVGILGRLEDRRVPAALVQVAGRESAHEDLRAAALRGLGPWLPTTDGLLAVFEGYLDDPRPSCAGRR